MDGDIVPRLDFTFLTCATIEAPHQFRKPKIAIPNFTRDYYEFAFHPSVTFKLTPYANIELGYQLQRKMPKVGDATTTQWIYSGFRLQF
jgi:hypothetical protein